MSSVIQNTINHIKKTIGAMPSTILTSFPEMRSAGFVDVDKLGGARVELEEMVGRSRVFEISMDGLEENPLQLGQAVPEAFNMTLTVRVRYDAQGLAVRGGAQADAMKELAIISKAIQASDWPSVTGLVTLSTGTGRISTVTLADESGATYKTIISEIAVAVSIDM
jgi:hypothetical protein